MILGQSELAPKIGSFVVFRVTEDGLSRVDGRTTHAAFSFAEDRARDLAVKNPLAHYTVLEVKGSFWHTPAPDILTDLIRDVSA